MEFEVEFVKYAEVGELLDDYGIDEVEAANDCRYLRMAEGEGAVHLHLAAEGSTCQPHAGASVLKVSRERLPQLVEHILHLLHLSQLLLIPVGKWRKVFDAVAFSLASNEDWQEVDATATVELNTRDPLLCEPADFHTLIALIEALVRDADAPDQGLMFIAAASPVLVEVVPDGVGAVRISVGSQVLADELSGAFAS